MIFFDSHIHNKGAENKGFLVGLEGEPWFAGTLHNHEAKEFASDENYLCFHYIEASELGKKTDFPFLKYHPRREKYSSQDVIQSIQVNQPKCVMLDTLNEPFWTPYDYWAVARAFPEIRFVFPHAGGYLVNDFIKICHFQPNVWIDFSLTHTQFGSISKNPLPYVEDAVKYALHSPFKSRVLMGSDYPFFNQEDVVEYYQRHKAVEMLNDNFLNLFTFLKDNES